jgi:hypothetical protein
MNTSKLDTARLVTGADLIAEQQHVGVAGAPILVWVSCWQAWAIAGIAGVLGPAGGPAERFTSLQAAHDCLIRLGITRYLVKGAQQP